MPQFFIFFFYLSFNRDRISFGFQKTEPHWSWSEGFWISKFVVLIWSMVSNDRFWLSSRKKKTKGKLLLIKNEKKPSDLANAIWSSKTLINPRWEISAPVENRRIYSRLKRKNRRKKIIEPWIFQILFYFSLLAKPDFKTELKIRERVWRAVNRQRA